MIHGTSDQHAREIVNLACQVAEFTNEHVADVVTAAYKYGRYGLQVIIELLEMLQEQIDLFVEENPELFDNDDECYVFVECRM